MAQGNGPTSGMDGARPAAVRLAARIVMASHRLGWLDQVDELIYV